MPTYQDQLEEIYARMDEWKHKAVSTFVAVLSDENKLLEAFLTRESLVKNGVRFPGSGTPSAELKVALNAMDAHDFTVYKRYHGDADRWLVLVEEPEFEALCSVRDYLPLSTALTYDAAAFYTIMVECYEVDSEFRKAFLNLIEASPEEALEQQKSLFFAIKQAMEHKILQLEYQRIEARIMDEQAIPQEFKEQVAPLCISLDEMPSVSVNDLRDRIVALHLKYQAILEKIALQKASYEQAKQELRDFIGTTANLPARLKDDGLGLLADVLQAEAEGVQHVHTIYQPAMQAIYEWMNQALREIDAVRKLEVKRDKRKQLLEQVLESEEVRELFKTQGRLLLSSYVAQETTADWDTLPRLSEELSHERKMMLRNEARARLQDIVDDSFIPDEYKKEVSTLLQDQETSLNRAEQACRQVAFQVARQKQFCYDAVYQLRTLLRDETISAHFKTRGRELLQVYLDKNQSWSLEELTQHAKVLAEESVLIREKDSFRRDGFHRVIDEINVMRWYGNTFDAVDEKKKRAINELADALVKKMDEFVEDNVRRVFTFDEVKTFIGEFRTLLHSKDTEMEKHRAKWKPILANIFIALTGIGFLALLVKVGANVVQSVKHDKTFKMNHSFFFAETKSEQYVRTIEHDMDVFASSALLNRALMRS